MKITTETLENNITRIVLDGRLDIEGAATIDLKMNVLAGSAANLLLDLEQVGFLGSMGLRALLVPAQAVRRRGGRVAIFKPQPIVEEVLKAAAIEAIVPIRHDLESALAVFRD